jgi:hypothetical protein
MKRIHPLYFVTLSSLFICFSCVSDPHIESYYIENGVQQYFIRPSEMKGIGCRVSIDFTYRSSNDYSVCNFTVSTDSEVFPDPGKVFFSLSDGSRVDLQNIEVLFVQKTKKQARFSVRIAKEDFIRILASKPIKLSFSQKGREYEVVGTKEFYVQMKGGLLEIGQ